MTHPDSSTTDRPVITDLYTDTDGYTWHICHRSGGSLSLYATRPFDGIHYVVYDTLDGNPPGKRAQAILEHLDETAQVIGILLEAARR